jgi:hypothetical protein
MQETYDATSQATVCPQTEGRSTEVSEMANEFF